MTSNNIKVAIRLRPLLKTERDQKLVCQWEISDKNIRSITTKTEPFYFDNIFEENASNCELFDAVAKPIVVAAVNGTNGAIFAYGEASSGKTYTMLGDETNAGIISLAVKEIFKEIEKCVDREFILRVTYMELHNENLYDLLRNIKTKKGQKENKKMQMKVGVPDTEHATINCVKQILKNEKEVIDILQTGKENRSYIGINIKEKLSKSHTIFQIVIESRKINRNSDNTLVQISTLDLVDLSSSEQDIQSDLVQSKRSKQNSITNKSLLTLSQIIKDLSDGKEHCNTRYQNSKLTMILKEPLGNNALAAFICNINPTTTAGTYSVLNFAMHIKNIKNVPKVNEILSDIYNSMFVHLDSRISGLRAQLDKNCNTNKKRELEKQLSNEQLKILRSHSKDFKIVKSNKKTKSDSNCTPEKLIECPHDNIAESYRLREQDLGAKKCADGLVPTIDNPDLETFNQITQHNLLLSDSLAHDINQRHELMLLKTNALENLKVEENDKNIKPILPIAVVPDLEPPKQISQNDNLFHSDSSAHHQKHELMLPKTIDFENLKGSEPTLAIAGSDLETPKEISQNDLLSNFSAHDMDQRHELMLSKTEIIENFENLEQVLKHRHDDNDKFIKQIYELQKKINQNESEKLLLRKKNLKDEEEINEKLEEKAKEKQTEIRAISERCHQLESDKIKHLEHDIKRLSAFERELKQQDDSFKQRETEYMAVLNEKDAKITSLMNEISLHDTNQLVLKGKECKILLVAPSSQEMQYDTLDYENNNKICSVKDSKMDFKKYDELSIQLSQYFQESFKFEIQEETLSRKQSKRLSHLHEPKEVVSACTLPNKRIKSCLFLCQRRNEILKNRSKFCNDNHIVKNFVSYLDNLEANYNQLEIDIEDTNNVLENMVNRFTCSNSQQLNLVDHTDSIMPKRYQIKYLRYILKKFIYSIKDINLNHSILLYNDHIYYKQSFSKQINILLHNSLIQLPRQLSLLNNPILYSLYKIDFTIQKLKAIIEYQENEKNINKHEIERINVCLQQSYDEREQIKTKYSSLISEYNTMKIGIEVFKNEFTECLSQLDTLSGSTEIFHIKNNILIAIRNILKVDNDARFMENVKVQFKNIKHQINKKLTEKSEDGEIETQNNIKLLNKISELNLEVSKLKKKSTQLETDIILLEQKLKENKSCSDFETISSEIKTALLQSCALENSMEAIKDADAELKNELLSKTAECDILRNEFELCQITLNKCEKQNASLIFRIQNNEMLLKQAEDEYNSLRASINLIQDELLKERKSEALSQKNIALQEEINIWQQKHADAVSMSNKDNRQCLLYKTKITSLENALKYQQDEVKAWQDKYADVLNKLNKKIEQCNKLNNNNITLKTTINELELKLENDTNNSISKKQYDHIFKQCSKYQDEIINLENLITKLNKKNTEYKNKMRDINKDMKIIKEKYEDTSKELSEATMKCLSYKNELLEYKISSKHQTEWKENNNERIHHNLKEDIKTWEYKYDNLLKRRQQDLDLYNSETIGLENIIKALKSNQLEMTRKNEKLTIILENIYEKLKQQFPIETLPQKFALDANYRNLKLEKNIFVDGDEIYAQRQEELIDHLIEDHKNLKIKNEKLMAEINSTRIACQQERKVRRQTLHDEKRQSVTQ